MIFAISLFYIGYVLSENMNGLYIVASGNNQNTNYNTNYSSKGYEYFDVYSPELATHYGDVFWHDLPNLPLPQTIINRFAGKVLAIVGYEQDQVMVQPTGEPGVNPNKDVSVPINWAYNHHYMAWMTGSYSMIKIEPTTSEDKWYYHGSKYKLVPVDKPSAKYRNNPDIPTSQMFSEGNGGESRKSFHGYPKGYAQLIESPETWHIIPMQIDTRNRECGATINDINNCTSFIPGIEPLQARYGRGIPNIGTNYSGLLECPCNSKFGGDEIFYGNNTLTKQIIHEYTTLQSNSCNNGELILTAEECFNIVYNIGYQSQILVVNKTVNDNINYPIGCSVIKENNMLYAYFNNAQQSNAECSVSNIMSGSALSPTDMTIDISITESNNNATFTRLPAGDYCSKNLENVLATFPSTANNDTANELALSNCETFCKTNLKCNYCSVDCSSVPYDGYNTCQWTAIPICGDIYKYNGPYGLIIGDISIKNPSGIVNITITGPSDVWFGVGFNAYAMNDQPYAIISNSTDVWEQKIGTCGSESDHCPGTILNKTINILSNSVINGVRIVKISRNLVINDNNYYSFIPSEQGSIPLITAIGESQIFSYHKMHGNTEISLLMNNNGNTCVCDIGANGKLCENNGNECISFIKNCINPPDGSLVEQNNPTCNSRQYSGGLSCCRDGHNLLDYNQTIPDQLLRYHMKFRFWFEEYTNDPVSHYNLDRIYQQTEANAGEYDIPPAFVKNNEQIVGYPDWPENKPTPGTHCQGNCPNGNDCQCYHEIQYKWIESPNKPMRLIYAGGHCHAPSCISLNLYRNDTGELLCSQIPVYGKGNVNTNKYDEAGYILIPPCLWGNETGLNPSILLPAGTPLLSIKKNWNTNVGHFGEMASWQMRGTYF